jgi:nanoRNase/pAp phosphatase (c-di-AMP/oligoRNAs hydrolase)
MFKLDLKDFKSFLQNKKILITTHDLVDLDGYVSSYIFNFFFKQFFNNRAYLIFPELALSTRNFIEKVSKKFPEVDFSLNQEFDLSEIDVLFVLDTNNLEHISIPNMVEILNSNIPFIFIDHHINLKKAYQNNLSKFNIIEEKFTSTSEIIFEICEYFNFELKNPFKFLLIAAILTDSGFYKYANNETIKRISKLLNNDLNYQEIISVLEYEPELSEKLAQIKALQRIELIRVKDYLIGITHVGSFEANVANLLINLGFDVGIVYSEKKTASRISTRAKKRVCFKTGLNLGKIMDEISKEYASSGGGHDGAASINCKNNVKEILGSILEKIKQNLNGT